MRNITCRFLGFVIFSALLSASRSASAQTPSISFTASPISITAGQSSTLSWSVTNATTVWIDH